MTRKNPGGLKPPKKLRPVLRRVFTSMAEVRVVLVQWGVRKADSSLCIGCPIKRQCNHGNAHGFHVQRCDVSIDKDAAEALLLSITGIRIRIL